MRHHFTKVCTSCVLVACRSLQVMYVPEKSIFRINSTLPCAVTNVFSRTCLCSSTIIDRCKSEKIGLVSRSGKETTLIRRKTQICPPLRRKQSKCEAGDDSTGVAFVRLLDGLRGRVFAGRIFYRRGDFQPTNMVGRKVDSRNTI